MAMSGTLFPTLTHFTSEKRTLLLVNERLPVLPLRGGLAK